MITLRIRVRTLVLLLAAFALLFGFNWVGHGVSIVKGHAQVVDDVLIFNLNPKPGEEPLLIATPDQVREMFKQSKPEKHKAVYDFLETGDIGAYQKIGSRVLVSVTYYVEGHRFLPPEE